MLGLIETTWVFIRTTDPLTHSVIFMYNSAATDLRSVSQTIKALGTLFGKQNQHTATCD